MSHSELVQHMEETLQLWQVHEGLTWQAKLLAKKFERCDDMAPIMACESLGFDSGVTWAELAEHILAAED